MIDNLTSSIGVVLSTIGEKFSRCDLFVCCKNTDWHSTCWLLSYLLSFFSW